MKSCDACLRNCAAPIAAQPARIPLRGGIRDLRCGQNRAAVPKIDINAVVTRFGASEQVASSRGLARTPRRRLAKRETGRESLNFRPEEFLKMVIRHPVGHLIEGLARRFQPP